MKSIRLRHRDGVYAAKEAGSPDYRPDFEVNDVTELARLLGAGVRLWKHVADGVTAWAIRRGWRSE
ncbi:MAG: hypothetical protein M5U34_11065 [Chloroflexi bacterium]|nr:hypothetical protein [Chloroflexota bacterium]